MEQNLDTYILEEYTKDYLASKARFETSLRKDVVNKEIPLDIRWKCFVDSGIGKHDYCEPSFRLSENPNWERHIWAIHWMEDRYKTVLTKNIYEWLLEKKKYFSDEEIDDFREEVLENFLKSFKYDW